MKKFALLIVAALFTVLSYGQFSLGIKGAVTMSSLTTNIQDIEEAAKTGWQFGAFVRIGDKWHLQPEVYFTAKPGQLSYSFTSTTDPASSGTVTQDITLSTVDIPLLVGYKIIDPPTLNIRLQAGPVASFVTDKTFSITSEGIDPPEVSDGYKEEFSNMNWGLQFGAGVDFLFLTADIRYELGLNKLLESTGMVGGNEPYSGEMKNNVFMLSLGWKFM